MINKAGGISSSVSPAFDAHGDQVSAAALAGTVGKDLAAIASQESDEHKPDTSDKVSISPLAKASQDSDNDAQGADNDADEAKASNKHVASASSASSAAASSSSGSAAPANSEGVEESSNHKHHHHHEHPENHGAEVSAAAHAGTHGKDLAEIANKESDEHKPDKSSGSSSPAPAPLGTPVIGPPPTPVGVVTAPLVPPTAIDIVATPSSGSTSTDKQA